jgi:hypothetical protein
MPNQTPTSSNQTGQSRGRSDRKSSSRADGKGGQANQESSNAGSPRTEDHVYGVVSILYHALQGAQTYDQYIGDARRAGDSELEEFFTTCRTEEHARAEQAKSLLLERLEEEEETAESGSEAEDEDDDEEEEDDDEG